MEESTISKLEAVNESLRSSVLIGTVDILSEDDIEIVDLMEECEGVFIKDRPDLVGFPLSTHTNILALDKVGEAKIPRQEIAKWIKYYRESERLQKPVEFELETSSFITDEHPVFRVLVAHEGGNRFSFVVMNLTIKSEQNKVASDLEKIYKPILRRLWEAKVTKYKESLGAFCPRSQGSL